MELVVALPVLRADENSKLSPHFGRSPYFSIAKIKDGEVIELKFFKNTYIHMHGHHMHGHGDHSDLFRNLIDSKVNAVIAIHMGHRALIDLLRLGIKVYLGVNGTVRDNLDKFIKGELKEVSVENADLLVDHRHHHH